MISVGERRSRRCEWEATIMGSGGRSLAPPPASQSWEVCVSQWRKNDGAKGSGKDRGASFSPPFWTHEEEKLETETEALETLRKLNTGFNGQSDSVAACFCKMTRELDPSPLSWGCYCSCSYFCLTRPRQRIARALSLTHTRIDKYIQFR